MADKDKPQQPNPIDSLMQSMSLLPGLPMQGEGFNANPPTATSHPLGFLSDPIVQHLQKRGLPLTKAMWLMIDSGSPSLEQLRDRPETAAYLDRLFPNDEES